MGHIPLHSENLLRATKTGSRAPSGSRSNTLATPGLSTNLPFESIDVQNELPNLKFRKCPLVQYLRFD